MPRARQRSPFLRQPIVSLFLSLSLLRRFDMLFWSSPLVSTLHRNRLEGKSIIKICLLYRKVVKETSRFDRSILPFYTLAFALCEIILNESFDS